MILHLHQIRPSSRPSKKLMALFTVDGKLTTVHFGGRGYMDYLKYYAIDPQKAKRKRAQYISRHRVTETWRDPLAAGTLARYILWELPTLAGALRAYKKRFQV